MALSITFDGFRELDKRLHALSDKVAKRVIRKAMRKAWSPIADAAAQNAPVSEDAKHGEKPGTLKESIKLRIRQSRKTGTFVASAGASGRDNPYTGERFYAGFVEFGHFQGSRVPRAYVNAARELWHKNLATTGRGRVSTSQRMALISKLRSEGKITDQQYATWQANRRWRATAKRLRKMGIDWVQRSAIREKFLRDTGDSRKFIPAQPFLRPAYDSKVGGALDTLQRELGNGIAREANAMVRAATKAAGGSVAKAVRSNLKAAANAAKGAA